MRGKGKVREREGTRGKKRTSRLWRGGGAGEGATREKATAVCVPLSHKMTTVHKSLNFGVH